MDSCLSGIERLIIFLGVKNKRKFYFNVFTHKWIRIMGEYIKIKFSLFLGVSIRRENFRYEN